MLKLKMRGFMNPTRGDFPQIQAIKVFALLAVTTWVAHFWYCQSFGLYEDDLHRIPQVMGPSWTELWKAFFYNVEGRPLHGGFISLFSFLGMRMGGLHYVYGIGYAIVTANAFLFYVLLRRLSGEQVFAITGALAFCLFPADTTQAFLTHALGIQPSLMFLLTAFLCFLSGKRTFSYLAILASLLCYETMVPVFLAAPLLEEKWDSKLAGKIGRHFLILVLMMVCVVIVRMINQEVRMSGISTLPALSLSLVHVLKNVFTGPAVALFMFLYRPFRTLLSLDKEMLMVLPWCLAGFMGIFFQLKTETLAVGKEIPRRFSEFFNPIARLAFIGSILLILAYPLTFRVWATAIDGRASRVHAAAIVGASMLIACACSVILFVANRYRQKVLAISLLAAFFTLLTGFGLTVQRDYKITWQYERAFWTDVIRLCPDMTDGTVILFKQRHLKQTRQINSRDWGISVLLDSIYQFPRAWKRAPQVYRLKGNWREKVVLRGDSINIGKAIFWDPPPRRHTIKDSDLILLEVRQGLLTRRTKPLKMGDRKLRLKENLPLTLPAFSKKPLYDYLIKDSGEKPINYLQ